MKYDNKDKIIKKQINKLNKKGKKLIVEKEPGLINKKIDPIKERLEDKVPEKLRITLEKYFEKGFKLVFEKGTSVIEKSYDKEKINAEFDIDNYAIDKQMTKKNLNKIDKKAGKKLIINKSLSVLEGTVLGALGIGLPDIPLFIAVILKSIYEVSLSYGYDYNKNEEKMYILNIICAASTKGEEKRKYLIEIDNVGEQIDKGIETQYNVEEMIVNTAKEIANSMLLSKFLQGFMIIGAIGGISNYITVQNVSKVSKIKYKQRYLNKLQY